MKFLTALELWLEENIWMLVTIVLCVLLMKTEYDRTQLEAKVAKWEVAATQSLSDLDRAVYGKSLDRHMPTPAHLVDGAAMAKDQMEMLYGKIQYLESGLDGDE